MEIVSVADVSPRDDDFLSLELARDVRWIGLSGLPESALERWVTRLRLSRYRAALQAAYAARVDRVVISHLPLMTAAAAEAMRVLDREARHLAFSFNFTNRPRGRRLSYFRHALQKVDQFAVFSQFERALYSQLFEIEEDRFAPVMWTQKVPPVESLSNIQSGAPYFCAIGGEGRDIPLILEAARILGSAIKVVVIARPYCFADLSVPDNVQAMTNVPLAETWGIACNSLGVLVPLLSEDTCCGHITLVSAKQLGLPVVTTRSFATREYVDGRASILECDAGDTQEFAHLLEKLADDHGNLRRAAQAAAPQEIQLHDRSNWARYVDRFLDYNP